MGVRACVYIYILDATKEFGWIIRDDRVESLVVSNQVERSPLEALRPESV